MHASAFLSDTTTYSIWRFEPRRRIQRPEWHSGVDLCKIPYANFPEFTFHALWCIRWCAARDFSYRLISTSSTHASNNATRVEKTMPATSQYRLPNPPTSTEMPATSNGNVAI